MEDVKEILISIREALISIKEEQERANYLKEIELGIKSKSDYDAKKIEKQNERKRKK